MKKHVVIAIPAYSWQIHLSTMRSVLADVVSLVKRGDAVSIDDESGSTDLPDARAVMVARFLAGTGTHLINIDNDVFWQDGGLLRLVDQPVDFVAGVYPKRQDPIEFPVQYLDGEELRADPVTGLLEVKGVQGGFCSYTRGALERMVAAYPDLAFENDRSPVGTLHALFDPVRVGNVKHGEDFSFCHRWRAIGGRVWVDPEIGMGHVGFKNFMGKFGDYLRNRVTP